MTASIHHPASEPVILFVTYGNGHIAKVAPVLRALKAQGVATIVMALTLGYNQAKRLGLEPLGYQDFLHLVDGERALQYGRELLAGNSHPDVDEAESIAYLGINYLEWVDRHGEAEAKRLYGAGGRRTFTPTKFIGKVIDELQPSLVVSTASPRSEQAAIEAAVKRGLPTMTMMDLFALPHDNFRRNRVFADRITVVSGFAKDNLIEAGIPHGRIEVTGCPAYDGSFDQVELDAGLAWKRSMGWENLRVVMWAGNLEEPAGNVPEHFLGTGLGTRVESHLRNWVASRSDVALLVRYHPTQYHLFPDLGAQERVYVSSPAADRLYPQLHASDCVVTQTSTVGFEGALIGKRLLALSFSPLVINFDFDYGRLGLGESVPSLDALVPMLDSPDPGRPLSSAFPPHGPATPRVVACMLNLMEQHVSRSPST